ncbi:MAG: DUF488 domain-containing protein [Devosia sp.]|uniref:DUF488 domain-containing protein n=1 Tax=Devosia sp. TaxID=1871048 RepID=UPI003392CFC7
MEESVFTFGYEGLTIERFVSRLRAAGICAIADVRAVPISRKKGFSKTAFAECLRSNGIEYQHFVELGCPKDVRDQYREDNNWARYEIGYLAHLQLQGAAIKRLSDLTVAKATCLVCFEEDYTTCHRMYVARELFSQTGQRVTHLTEGRAILDPVARRAKAA